MENEKTEIRSLDRTKNQPLYMQIREDLLSLIQESGQQGGPFFSDKELVERYGINRLTIRRAVDGLVEDGILYRVRGVGTFISEQKIGLETTASHITTFEEYCRKKNKTVRTEILVWEVRSASAEVCRRFGVEPNTQLCYLERMRFIDDTPVALDKFYFPEIVHRNVPDKSHCSQLMAQIFNRGTHEHVATETLEIEAALIGKNEADQFELVGVEPALVVSISGYRDNGAIAFTGKTWHRGNLFKYSIQIPK